MTSEGRIPPDRAGVMNVGRKRDVTTKMPLLLRGQPPGMCGWVLLGLLLAVSPLQTAIATEPVLDVGDHNSAMLRMDVSDAVSRLSTLRSQISATLLVDTIGSSAFAGRSPFESTNEDMHFELRQDGVAARSGASQTGLPELAARTSRSKRIPSVRTPRYVCRHLSCEKTASYGPPRESSPCDFQTVPAAQKQSRFLTHCAEHAPCGFVDRKHRHGLCRHIEGCGLLGTWADLTDPAARYCARHRLPGMSSLQPWAARVARARGTSAQAAEKNATGVETRRNISPGRRSCEHPEGCRKTPSFAGAAQEGRARFCAAHRPTSTTGATTPHCTVRGCCARPTYGVPRDCPTDSGARQENRGGKLESAVRGKGSIIGGRLTHCSAHRLPGMQKSRSLCRTPDCSRAARFGHPGPRPIHTFLALSCTEIGTAPAVGGVKLKMGTDARLVKYLSADCMSDVSGPSEGDTVRGPENSKALKARGCIEQETGALFCGKHRKAEHVDLANKACKEEGCWRRASFGLKGSTGASAAQWCARHADRNVTEDVRHPRCRVEGCRKLPSFGDSTTGVALHCRKSAPGVLDGVISQHAPAGAVNVQLLRCERPRCSARPLFSRRAAQPAGGAEEGSSDSGVVRLLLCRKHTPKAALQAPSLSCRTASAPSSPVLSPASSWATRSCASGQGSSGEEDVLSPGLEGRAAALTIEDDGLGSTSATWRGRSPRSGSWSLDEASGVSFSRSPSTCSDPECRFL